MLLGGTSGSRVLQVYDSATDAWTLLAPLPHGVNSHAVATDGSYIYVMGGADSTTALHNWLQIYNVSSNSWYDEQNVVPFKTRANTCAAFYNGLVYVFGGQSSITPTISNEVIAYDPHSSGAGQWQTKSSSGFTPRVQASCGILGSKVFIFDGTSQPSSAPQVQSAVESYDFLFNSWKSYQTIGLSPRFTAASVAINGKIYVFGGGGFDGYHEISTLEVFDPQKVSLYWFRKN